ncbi:MAG: hypothetical protein F2864_11825, partial [Actinobacteria bacterium]|nr:hypothetical protein [Actinomycetota bacterium]
MESTEPESTEPEPGDPEVAEAVSIEPETAEAVKTPRRRVSFFRVVVALLLVAGVSFATVSFVNRAVDQ